MNTRRQLIALLLALAGAPLVHADGGGGGGGGGGDSFGLPAKSIDPQYAAAVEAVNTEQYAKALPLLEAYVARVPDDADAQNYLGFSYRKLGQLDAAFRHYDKALTLDPKHRGAHEYLGEAYLMAGNLAKAEEHLKILDGLCFFPCNEYTMLKKSVAAYKSANPVTVGTVPTR